MFARYLGIHWNLTAVCPAVLFLAAVSLAAIPAHGFDLKPTWQDGMKAATDDLKALGAEGSAATRKSPGQEGIDREIDRLAGQAADKAERAMWKVGKKAWGLLEKTKKYGPLAKKLGKRWGAAARMGTRLSPHVGTALTVWDFGYAVGDKLIAPKVESAIDRHFDKKWEEQQAELSREIADLRRRGEERRERGKDVPSPIAAAIAVRMLMEDGRGPWARDTAEDPTPAAEKDPWAAESPDVRYARPVAVKTAPASDSIPAGSAKSAWDAETPAAGKDPWAAESPDDRFVRPLAEKAAPAPAKDVQTGPSNYEKALNSLRGGGGRSAGYKGALEKLEDDRRAEQARRETEARAERRRQQAARDAEARRAAAAQERDRQRALERARRDQREYSKRNYDNNLQQLNRSMQMLQQTRQKQQRAYQRQKALDLQRQRQRQRQLEEARRQRIYEQQRERDRQTYQPAAPARRSSGSGNFRSTPCNSAYGCSVR